MVSDAEEPRKDGKNLHQTKRKKVESDQNVDTTTLKTFKDQVKVHVHASPLEHKHNIADNNKHKSKEQFDSTVKTCGI